MTDPGAGKEIDGPVPAREDVTPAGESVPLPDQQIPDQAPTKEFEPLMQRAQGVEAPQTPSPMELVSMQQQGTAAEVTPDSLRTGVEQLNGKIADLRSMLTPQQLERMTDAQRALLQTKLGQFGDNVQGLSNRLGLKYRAPKTKGMLGDAKTFVDWLTQGQKQLETVGSQLAELGPDKMSVVAMLRAQAQLLAADRAINFASAVVSKGVDFVSKMFQTQI